MNLPNQSEMLTRKKKTPKTYEQEFDTEFGIVNLIATYEYDEGEPRVDYHRDGSGSPGVSPSVHIYDIKIEVVKHDVDLIRSLEEEILDGIITADDPNLD